MSSSLKTPQRSKTPQSSIARQRPSTGRVGSTASSPPTTLSFSPSFDVHGGGGASPQSMSSTTTTAPLDLSYPQLHHMKVQRRADQAQRKLGVHRSMLARLQDKVITAASSPASRPQTTSSTTTTPQSISKRIPTPNQGGGGDRRRSSPQQRDITTTTPESNNNNNVQHQRRLTPLGTSAFMSTSRRSQGLDASLCYSPTQMAMASPTPKKRPISSHRQAKREAYREDISHRKQFLNFLSLLQRAPNHCGGDTDVSVGTSALYPDSSSLLTIVPVGGDDDGGGESSPRHEGVLIVTLASSGGSGGGGESESDRWNTSESGVFRMGDIESVYSPLEPHHQLLYPVTIVVIQGRLLPQDMVGVANVVSSHPTLQELHLPDTPLDPFLRRTLNDITSSNINIQQVSWKRAQSTPPSQSSPRSTRNVAKASNSKTTSPASVFIKMSEITGSPTPSSTESDTEEDYYGTHHNNSNNINHDGSSSMYHSLLQQSRRRSRRRRRSSSGGGRSSVGSSSASRSQSMPAATTSRNNRIHQPDEEDWCLEEGGISDNECGDAVSGALSPYLGYYPPACQSRRQTLMTNPASGRPSIHIPPTRRGTASLSLTDDRLNISGTIGRPPRSPTSLPLEVSAIATVHHTTNTTATTPLTTTTTTTAHQSPYGVEGPSSSTSLSQWQERLIQYLQTAHPTLGPSPTKTALKWLHALQSQLHSNRRAVARRNKRRAHEANLSAYIERLDTMCFQVFSELVVSERILRTDITELQTAQRTHLYSLERQEGRRAHRLDQARRLLEEIGQRMEWVQGREGAFRDALAEEELSLRLAIFVEGMQPSGRSAIIATEVAVRSYAKAFESSSWAHYRGLQRSRQTRQQAEKDVIVAVESKGRSLIVREWVSGLRRGKEKEKADAEEISLRPTDNTLVEIALTRTPPIS